MIGVCVTFIRVAYGRRIYMSVPKIVKVQFLTQGFYRGSGICGPRGKLKGSHF